MNRHHSLFIKSFVSISFAFLLAGAVTAGAAPACVSYPDGLVGWWKGDGNAMDQVTGLVGKLSGNTTYRSGEVGQAFGFDGNGDSVNVGNSATLKLQNFTIEGWIKRDGQILTSRSTGGGILFGWGAGGFAFGLQNDGHLFLAKAGGSQVAATSRIITNITIYHHVAVTKSNTTVNFYVDGVSAGSATYAQTFAFTTSAAVGARGDGLNSFLGGLDELSVYDNALSAAQILGIYQAAGAGKCTTATLPMIVTQPADVEVGEGGTVVFSIGAASAWPLTFQWAFNGVDLHGATNAALTIKNAQTTNTGIYAVKINNALGTVISSNATLEVSLASGCSTRPSSLVAWWSGNGNALDNVGTNNGTLHGDTTYAAGNIHDAFVFDGDQDWVDVGNPPELQLQDFTIEAWVRRSDGNAASLDAGGGNFFGGSYGGYAVGLTDDGHLLLANIGSDAVQSAGSITDTLTFHHVAVAKQNNLVTFYIDGAIAGSQTYDIPFGFGGPMAIGANGTGGNSFLGAIDELSIYNDALTAQQVQYIYQAGSVGKCGVLAAITAQPVDQSAYIGDIVVFPVGTTGGPLSYQWFKNGANIPGAVNIPLVFTNVQFSDAGSYFVQVSGEYGLLTSVTAVLTVSTPTCTATPSGLVSWWRGESNTLDQAGGNTGVLFGNVTYGKGKVGQSFVFDGSGGGVNLGHPLNLQLQNFTIEGWVKRNDPAITGGSQGGGGSVFSWGDGGYAFGLEDSGQLFLSDSGYDAADSILAITNTDRFHHIAVTSDNGAVSFYLDGQAAGTADYLRSYNFGSGSTAGIGGRTDGRSSFIGEVDELSIYSSILTPAQILQIYNARSFGKCLVPIPPSILVQPLGGSNNLNGSYLFTVQPAGSPNFTYQWIKNGTNIFGATNLTLNLANIQYADAGSYAVVVSNDGGTVLSSNAILSVYYAPCVTPDPSIVSWWKGEGDARDEARGNDGALTGGASFGNAKSGLGFVFQQAGDCVNLGRPFALQIQDFTIEAWIKRGNPGRASFDQGGGEILGYGLGGYGFGMFDDGSLYLSKTGNDVISQQPGGVAILDTNIFHHVAVVKSGNAVVFYLDGVAGSPLVYNNTFAFSEIATIGAAGLSYNSPLGYNSFIGTIDELTVYAAPLSASQIQAIYTAQGGGKCQGSYGSWVGIQPAQITVTAGTNVTFNATAVSSTPINYQWRLNGLPIGGAINASLSLPNVQLNQAGSYSVVISNSTGSVTSSNAVLVVNPAPSTIQVVSVNGSGGSLVSVPIVLVGGGKESAVAFSLNFDPARMSFVDWTNHNAIPPAILVNTNLLASGKLGLAIGQPAGSTFPAGSNELLQVRFALSGVANSLVSPLSFGSVPSGEEIADVHANLLPANFANGTVTINFSGYEGDSAPRPDGDGRNSIADWVQVGRFAAQLDSPANASEFQRADCAPRSTLGDGSITVTDWVQAGRYAIGLDPATPAGGPTAPGPSFRLTTAAKSSAKNVLSIRQVSISSAQFLPGQNCDLVITLQAQGNENAAGFSLAFDPVKFSYIFSSPGTDASAATLTVNTNNAALGQLGFVLALSPGKTFPLGSQQIIHVVLRALGASANGNYIVSLTDLPVMRQISDSSANSLTDTSFINGAVVVKPLPSLSVGKNSGNITLAWPLAATNFALQAATNLMAWTNVTGTVNTNSGSNIISLPASGRGQLFRLQSR